MQNLKKPDKAFLWAVAVTLVALATLLWNVQPPAEVMTVLTPVLSL